MSDDYPRKYWWLVLILVPLAVAIIPALLSQWNRPNADDLSNPNACGHRLGPAIYAKWQQLEGEHGLLGCPLMDETDAASSRSGIKGRWARFTGNGFERGFIFLHNTGERAGQTFEVHGAIGQTYDRLGTTSSWLGFPISDEYDMPGGVRNARQSDFEGGYIAFNPATRTYEAYHR